ncbi:hypothetical protein [Streptomyces sp. NPDC056304]|uniref:hypothetical protein n=1 Tax=Streptomyces sp. NPDC056304 TaxID=3345778 RepID=UPI0035DF486E
MTDIHTTASLRREVAGTVALLVDKEDFTAMQQHVSFAHDDYSRYLDHIDDLLKTLTAEGGHITVALFDPEDYADYCHQTGLEPDYPSSRARYTADRAATGPRVTYRGQRLPDLISTLIDTAVRHATHTYATMLLAEGCEGPDYNQDRAGIALGHTSHLLHRLLDAAGPGTHHLVCSVTVDHEQLTATLHAARDITGATVLGTDESTQFCTVLAVGIALGSPGGIVLRTTTPSAPDQLHGWRLEAGHLHPLTEAEVFSAYCTDAQTGEPLAPEPHVDYCAGFPLTPDNHPHS